MNSLQKGGNISLSKIAPTVNNITVCIHWVKKSNDETEFDIDASAFMLTENKKIRADADFIFYNQPETADKAIQLVSQSLEKQQFVIVLHKIAFNNAIFTKIIAISILK